MKSLITLTILLLLINKVFGQQKTCFIPLYKTSDTTTPYFWLRKDIDKIGLNNLLQSKENLHIRLWTETQVIGVRTDDFKTFQGWLFNYTTSIDKSYSNSMPAKFYSSKTTLDTLNSKKGLPAI